MNSEWLFADYAVSSYTKGTVFDIVIPPNGVDWNSAYKIKLTKITDEFGRTFSEIPEGYKTICQFEFSPNVPQLIRQLALMEGWMLTDNAVYLCQHSDINLLASEINRDSEYVFLDLFMSELRKTHNRNKYRISIQDLLKLLKDYSPAASQHSLQMIIDTMLLSGRAKKENDELILMEKLQ